VTAKVARAGLTEAQAAVDAAHRAQTEGPWGRMSGRERGRMLERLAAALEASADDFAMLELLQTGKPITEARGDVSRAIDGLRFYAAAALMNRGETIEVDSHRRAQTIREPIGVIAAIVPWNVPLVLTVSKIAPALAMGNTVVVKPSEFTPLTALLLAEKAREAGFPPGVVNVVTGTGGEIGRFLTETPLVGGITFTGSTRTGAKVGAAAAMHHKRLQAELGGKSAHIVFADTDLDRATSAAAWGVFYGQGQICSAGSRLLVERSVHDRVLEAVADIARNIVPGDPRDPATRMGSLISRAHRDGVRAHVEAAVAEGARIVAGGGPAEVAGFEGGAFMQPTVLADVRPGSAIEQEEVFGPVLSVIPFDTEDEAVAIANGTRYGLAAGIWSGDRQRAMRMVRRLRTGVVWLDSYNHFDPLVPFGGVKHSGGGSREWSHLALDCFVDLKTVWEVM
jgi:acyl-CoA reductase-like NAD-dependent aldehyde dehydrogenase